jgi:hypothetical protein
MRGSFFDNFHKRQLFVHKPSFRPDQNIRKYEHRNINKFSMRSQIWGIPKNTKIDKVLIGFT